MILFINRSPCSFFGFLFRDALIVVQPINGLSTLINNKILKNNLYYKRGNLRRSIIMGYILGWLLGIPVSILLLIWLVSHVL